MNSPGALTMQRRKVRERTTSVPEMKTIYMDMHLEFEEKLLKAVGTSIDKTKRRLHEAELTMNLKPPDDEPEALQHWKEKCEELINRRETTEFPTLFSMKKEFDKKALIKSIKQNRNRMLMQQKMGEIFTKQTEMIRKKVMSKGGRFGRLESGAELRTIDDYSGCNAVVVDGKRVLIRKEGDGIVEPSARSVPPWMGPQFYADGVESSLQYLTKRRDNHYQVAFKSAPRTKKAHGRAVATVQSRRANNSRRRQRVDQMKRMIAEEPNHLRTAQSPTDRIGTDKGITQRTNYPVHQIRSEETPNFEKRRSPARPDSRLVISRNDEARPSSKIGSGSISSVAGTSDFSAAAAAAAAADNAPSNNKLIGEAKGALWTDNDDHSIHSNTSYESGDSSEFFIHDTSPLKKSPLPLQWSRRSSFALTSKPPTPEGLNAAPNQWEAFNIPPQKSAVPVAENKSKVKTSRTKRKPPPQRLNPLAQSHAFAFKLLDTDGTRNQRSSKFFRVRDYTMGALSLQDASAAENFVGTMGAGTRSSSKQHLTLAVKERQEKQFEALPDSLTRNGLYAQQHKRRDSITEYPQYGRFTSDIFNVKAPDFVQPKKESRHLHSRERLNSTSTTTGMGLETRSRAGSESVHADGGPNDEQLQSGAFKTAAGGLVASSKDSDASAEGQNESEANASLAPKTANDVSEGGPLSLDIEEIAGRSESGTHFRHHPGTELLAPLSNNKPRTVENMLVRRSYSRRGAFFGAHSPDSPAYLQPRRSVLNESSAYTRSSPVKDQDNRNLRAFSEDVSAGDKIVGRSDSDDSPFARIDLSGPAAGYGEQIKNWCDSNGVILCDHTRKHTADDNGMKVSGKDFLASHRPMQPIALSLTGLLLDDNPYTPDNEYIKDYFHKEAKDIGI